MFPVAALNGGSYNISIRIVKDTSINENKMADYATTVSNKCDITNYDDSSYFSDLLI